MVNSMKSGKKKIEIYENEGKVWLKQYTSLLSELEELELCEKEVYKYLGELSRYKIQNITNNDEVKVCYDGFEIYLNRSVLSNVYLYPLLLQINRFNNKKNAQKVKGKKVKREKRHVGKRVIALGLAALTIYGIAKNLKNNKKAIADETIPTPTYGPVVVDEGLSEKETNQEIMFVYDEPTQVIESESDNRTVEIDFTDFVADREKADYVDEHYADLITKLSKRYGVDPEIMIAIAKQESGVHDPYREECAVGLMQIERSVWTNETCTVHNCEDDIDETFVFTEDFLASLEGNIIAAIIVYKEACEQMKNNCLLSLQNYNMGYGNMMKVLRAYSESCGRSVDDIIDDVTDTGWMDFRYVTGNQGDKYYVERICAYLADKLGHNIYISSVNNKILVIPANVKTFN